jgi:hypothetical protein
MTEAGELIKLLEHEVSKADAGADQVILSVPVLRRILGAWSDNDARIEHLEGELESLKDGTGITNLVTQYEEQLKTYRRAADNAILANVEANRQRCRVQDQLDQGRKYTDVLEELLDDIDKFCDRHRWLIGASALIKKRYLTNWRLRTTFMRPSERNFP